MTYTARTRGIQSFRVSNEKCRELREVVQVLSLVDNEYCPLYWHGELCQNDLIRNHNILILKLIKFLLYQLKKDLEVWLRIIDSSKTKSFPQMGYDYVKSIYAIMPVR